MNLLKKILVLMIISLISCKKEYPCIDPFVSRELIIRNIDYLPKTGVLYYYDSNNDNSFKLIKKEILSIIKKGEKNIYSSSKDTENNIHLFSKDTENKYLRYNYRLIVDDTLCFELSDFQTIPDTMGRTMGGWAIRCLLVSYKCNDKIYKSAGYNFIDPPFESRRIIKKGQYDQ